MQEFSDLKYKLEENVPLRESVLWDLQHRFYSEQGPQAWRNGRVPQYVTSNPTVARAYAEIILAFRRDFLRNSQVPESELGPITICELGAGTGRLAFHIISILQRMFPNSGPQDNLFRYVLTDYSESNVAAWKQNPKLQYLFEQNLVDVAHFDVGRSDRLELQISGDTIKSGDLSAPMVVIGNYLFDSIPQDLYYIDRGQAWRCTVSVATDLAPLTTPTAELVESLAVKYTPIALAEQIGDVTSQDKALKFYVDSLSDTYLLFPSVSLESLDRLRALSTSGLLVLTADKGDCALADLQGQPPPPLVHHGSFSYTVNYHAFSLYCSLQDGVPLFPEFGSEGVSFGSLILAPNADHYSETRCAYQANVIDKSPADFVTISRHMRRNAGSTTVEEILSLLRLSGYDAHQFLRFLPRLCDLRDSMPDSARSALVDVINRTWEIYLPIGETVDLASHIGDMLYNMNEFGLALFYFLQSMDYYGDTDTTLFNMAACHFQLDQFAQAGSLLCTLLERGEDNVAAQELLEKCVASMSRLMAE